MWKRDGWRRGIFGAEEGDLTNCSSVEHSPESGSWGFTVVGLLPRSLDV